MSDLLKILTGSTRNAVAGARMLGRADPASRVDVSVVLTRRQPIDHAVLQQHVLARPRERAIADHVAFASRYGASDEAISAVRAHAATHGLTVSHVDAARRVVELWGTVANMERAFGTALSTFALGSRTFRGRQGPLLIPETLRPHIEAVLGLDNRPVARPHFRTRDVQFAYYPQQIAAAYAFPPGDGTGQTIAVIELGGNFGNTDLSAYFAAAGIAKPPVVHAISVTAGRPISYGQDPDSDGEVMLDIEVIGAMAPAAQIAVYFAENTDQGFYQAVSQAVHDQAITAISISWGSAEKEWSQQTMTAWASLGQSAALLNVPIFAAAGDHGCSDQVENDPDYDGQRHVDFPGTCPDGVFSCGGTNLPSPAAVASAAVWNDDDGWATGGGLSTVFQAPSWQNGLSADSGAALVMRGVPDVAGLADPDTGIRVRVSGADGVSGGTSAVAPQWAALTAILSQNLGRKAGFFLPLLYGNNGPNVTTDIVSGNNSVYGIGGYSAKAGWDACTGLGTPIGTQILALLGGAASVASASGPDAGATPLPIVITSVSDTQQVRAVSPFDPIAATLYGQCVQAAYSMYDADPGNLTPAPSADFPPGCQLTAWIQMQDFLIGSLGPSFYGFIAQSSASPETFVLAIRGTSNGMEWWDDANAITRVPFKIQNCGAVGKGFARIYDTLEIVERPTGAAAAPSVAQSLRSVGSFSQQVAVHLNRHAAASARAIGTPVGASVNVTGHSLGGALATLYAMENAHTDEIRNPLLCTFASPLVGDATFGSVFNALGLTSWRIVNEPDLVPRLPPEILGFRHVDAEQRFSSTGKVRSSPLCWHSLSTYLSLINPSQQPAVDCQLTSVALPAGTRAAVSPGVAAALAASGVTVIVNVARAG
jgi:kumamolisin